jgi:2-amino-4-hydroxy-6-hydroxymethyldihydropteridine diphosphokinase
VDAVIGLGSNLGDRRALLDAARRELTALGAVNAFSPLYETEPVGPPQPLFLNAAVLLTTATSPLDLLDELLGVERRLGRVRDERWGPRLIDLDILWIATGSFDSPRLTVPHPELRNRAFALRPLLDVRPDATDPRDGAAYRDVLAQLGADLPREIAGTRSSWT